MFYFLCVPKNNYSHTYTYNINNLLAMSYIQTYIFGLVFIAKGAFSDKNFSCFFFAFFSTLLLSVFLSGCRVFFYLFKCILIVFLWNFMLDKHTQTYRQTHKQTLAFFIHTLTNRHLIITL